MEPNPLIQALFSIVAIVISVTALYWTRESWLQTYRPIITVRVVDNHNSPESGTVQLDLVVMNSGNRPAKKIRLRTRMSILRSHFIPEIGKSEQESIETCFLETIDAVINGGEKVSSRFGCFAQYGGSWKQPCTISVDVSYEDLTKRHYNEWDIPLNLRGGNEEAFAGWCWGKSETFSLSLTTPEERRAFFR